jgi:hypothetical protein
MHLAKAKTFSEMNQVNIQFSLLLGTSGFFKESVLKHESNKPQ